MININGKIIEMIINSIEFSNFSILFIKISINGSKEEEECYGRKILFISYHFFQFLSIRSISIHIYNFFHLRENEGYLAIRFRLRHLVR